MISKKLDQTEFMCEQTSFPITLWRCDYLFKLSKPQLKTTTKDRLTTVFASMCVDKEKGVHFLTQHNSSSITFIPQFCGRLERRQDWIFWTFPDPANAMPIKDSEFCYCHNALVVFFSFFFILVRFFLKTICTKWPEPGYFNVIERTVIYVFVTNWMAATLLLGASSWSNCGN